MNITEYAIRMETAGEAFYSEQARLNKYNSIGVVSSLLAEAENSHARFLRDKAADFDFIPQDVTEYSGLDSVLENLGSISCDFRVVPRQADFYKKAMELEKQSIDFYRGMIDTSKDQDEKSLYEFLLEQEKCHFALLDDLTEMFRHSEVWAGTLDLGLRIETN